MIRRVMYMPLEGVLWADHDASGRRYVQYFNALAKPGKRSKKMRIKLTIDQFRVQNAQVSSSWSSECVVGLSATFGKAISAVVLERS